MAWTWSNLTHHTRTLWNPQNRSKIAALLLWITLFLAYEWYTLSHGLNQLDILRQLVAAMQSSALGPLLFILVYAIQPLFFFPSWLLSIAAGYVYGPTRGFAYLLVAGNLAALVAYGTGYFFGDGVLDEAEGSSEGKQIDRGLSGSGGNNRILPKEKSAQTSPIRSIRGLSSHDLHRYVDRLRAHSFETILFMRLLFLPFDALSYLAGFLHIRLPGFLLATLLGSIPGTLAFALFGASIEGGLDGQKLQFNPWNMAFSIGLFAVSILAWRLLRGKFGGDEKE